MKETHFHKRNLLHYYRFNSTYFITYRLKGTIPVKVLKELKQKYITGKTPKTKNEKYKNEKLFFAEYDKYLDNNKKIQHLTNNKVSEKVKESLHHYDKKEFNLICYTIMPNHVHVIFHLLEKDVIPQKNTQTGKSAIRKTNLQNENLKSKTVTQTFQSVKKFMNIDGIMKSIKGYSAREANKILKRKGNFWQSESFDHIVRDEDELNRIVNYVIMNPVKGKLVEGWQDWEHTYLADVWW